MNGLLKNKAGFTLGELLLVFAIVIGIAMLLTPIIRYNQARMDNIVCANNLRETGLAAYIYAREHEGKFPPSLETMYKEQYLADPYLMDCPASRAEGTPQDPDYIYTPGLSVRGPSLALLMKDKAGNHPRGKNVLFVNGKVAWQESAK